MKKAKQKRNTNTVAARFKTEVQKLKNVLLGPKGPGYEARCRRQLDRVELLLSVKTVDAGPAVSVAADAAATGRKAAKNPVVVKKEAATEAPPPNYILDQPLRASRLRTDMQTMNPGDVVYITQANQEDNQAWNISDRTVAEHRFAVCPKCSGKVAFDTAVQPYLWSDPTVTSVSGTRPFNMVETESGHKQLHRFDCSCGLSFVIKTGMVYIIKS